MWRMCRADAACSSGIFHSYAVFSLRGSAETVAAFIRFTLTFTPSLVNSLLNLCHKLSLTPRTSLELRKKLISNPAGYFLCLNLRSHCSHSSCWCGICSISPPDNSSLMAVLMHLPITLCSNTQARTHCCSFVYRLSTD